MMLHSGSGPESESESESEPQSQLQFQFPNRAQVPFVGHISFVSRYRHISSHCSPRKFGFRFGFLARLVRLDVLPTCHAFFLPRALSSML